MHNINAFGPFLGIKHASNYMKEAGKGSIVNTSSYTAIIGAGFNAYTASKGSLRAIARARHQSLVLSMFVSIQYSLVSLKHQ